MIPASPFSPRVMENVVSTLIRRGGHDGGLPRLDGEVDWEMYTYGLNGVDNRENFLLSSILFYTLCLLLFGLTLRRLHNLILVKTRQILLLHTNTREAFKYWATPAHWSISFTKKHILWAPVGRIKHNREIRLSSAISFGTLPTRLQAILLLVYFGSNAVYCTILLNWQLPRPQLIAEFRGRTGVLAVVNMVPLFLLAGRNNPLIWIFGISFDTWNLIHRWMGRVVALESTCHVVAWTINKVETSEHGWYSVWQIIQESQFVLTGLLGGIAFTAILIHSASPVRHAAYETFLHLHIAFATLGLVGVFYHLKIDKLPQIIYIFICIGIWSYDRLSRLLRLLYRNCGRRMTRFRIQALPGGGGACRVDIEMTRPWKYTPGSHAYVYLPWVSLWQSHPFSIAWSNFPGKRICGTEDAEKTSITRPETASSIYSNDLEMADIEKMTSTAMFVERANPAATTRNTIRLTRNRDNRVKLGPDDIPWSERNTISMVISKRTGMTKTLWEMANRCSNKTLYLKGFLEGEYGAQHGLYSHGMVILVAGGVGITHCIGWARRLLHLWKEGQGVARRVVLIWVVPDKEQYEWCREWFDEIFAIQEWEQFFTIQLYVSRPKGDMLVSPCVNVPAYAGRPDWGNLFNRFVEQKLGTIGVTVCGPGTLSDSIRYAVREQISNASIDFLEESFTW
ncbi:ferric reductase like transmembrane component-domain-containing protein [Kalaharituber pfeilii]|nr:ferric reductase like transmembrane component-domain-containing protein [Kalaharituber pfeilii]